MNEYLFIAQKNLEIHPFKDVASARDFVEYHEYSREWSIIHFMNDNGRFVPIYREWFNGTFFVFEER